MNFLLTLLITLLTLTNINAIIYSSTTEGVINTMILDVIQSKLATLRDMNNSGNIDCVKVNVVLDELELLSKIIAYPTNYKVERINGRTINVKLYFDTTTDGIIIEF